MSGSVLTRDEKETFKRWGPESGLTRRSSIRDKARLSLSALSESGAVSLLPRNSKTDFPEYERSRTTVLSYFARESPRDEARKDLPEPLFPLNTVKSLNFELKYCFPASDTAKPILLSILIYPLNPLLYIIKNL